MPLRPHATFECFIANLNNHSPDQEDSHSELSFKIYDLEIPKPVRSSSRALPLIERSANHHPPTPGSHVQSRVSGRDAFFPESPIALVLDIPFHPHPFLSFLCFRTGVEGCRTAFESILEVITAVTGIFAVLTTVLVSSTPSPVLHRLLHFLLLVYV